MGGHLSNVEMAVRFVLAGVELWPSDGGWSSLGPNLGSDT